MQISQRQLGITAGIEKTSASARINQYERGKHVPDYATLNQLAKVLHVPVSFFYCEDDTDAEFLLNMYELTPQQQSKMKQLAANINFKP